MRPIRQLGPALLLAAPLMACLPPEASSIAIVAGNQQGAPLQHPLPEPLAVGVFDRTGAPVAGAHVAWTVPVGSGQLGADTTTSLPSGVSQVRFTVGATPGTESIRANLVGTTESVTFSALAGQSQSPWPNEPAGFTTLTDWPYNQMVTRLDGGFSRGIEAWNQGAGTGLAAIVQDAGAPLSPPNVVQIVYPVGLPSGSAPWNLYYNVRGREYYTAFWWKANAEWQGDPSGINKIIFWQDAAPSSGNLIVMLNNQRQDAYFLTVTLEFNHATNGHLANSLGAGSVWHVFGNVRGGNYAIVPGTWYRIELHFKGSTTPSSQDGVLRWWATKLGDAAPTQVGDYTNVNLDTASFIQFGFTPTWGGNSGVTKAHQDYYWIDHVHLSRP